MRRINKAVMGRYLTQISGPVVHSSGELRTEMASLPGHHTFRPRHHHACQASQDLHGRCPLDERQFEIAYYKEAKDTQHIWP